MKKLGSQLAVALVCCILGFMISYQFKIINIQGSVSNNTSTENKSTDITVEIEQMKKEKNDLETKVNDLQSKLKNYEKSAAGQGDVSNEVLNELKETRLMLGTVDVKGPGIIITITPQEGLFGNNQEQPVYAKDLVTIVNALNSADAEAISINNTRITMKTGIRDAGSAIYIDEDKISPYDKIVIKVIGNKKLLDGEVNFKGAIPTFSHCKVEIDKSDNITINKCSNIGKFKYAKPSETN